MCIREPFCAPKLAAYVVITVLVLAMVNNWCMSPETLPWDYHDIAQLLLVNSMILIIGIASNRQYRLIAHRRSPTYNISMIITSDVSILEI